MCSSQGETREPGASALGVDSGSTWAGAPGPGRPPTPGWGGHHVSTGASVGDSADVRKPAPPTRPGFSFTGSEHIMQIVFLAHTAPTSHTASPHSEVNMHGAPTRVHPIPFKMPRCNSERTFSSQKANGEQQVMN